VPNTQLLTAYPNAYNLQVDDKSRSAELLAVTVSFQTSDDPDTVFQIYRSLLQQDGWKESTNAPRVADRLLLEIINSPNHPAYALSISATRTLNNVTTVMANLRSQGPR
jgi:hypothetical protein